MFGFFSGTKALLGSKKQQDKVGGYNKKGRGICMKRMCKALGRARLLQHTSQARAGFILQLLFVQHLPSQAWVDLVFINVSIKRLELT